MNLYIFGAGASKASQEGIAEGGNLPPLVNELFDEQYYSYAKLIHLPVENLKSYKASMNTQPLEQWLTSWWSGIKDIEDTNVQYAEKADFGKLTFYIWWIMQNISNFYMPENLYRKFLIKLKSRKEYPNIISFNYDTLLDKAHMEVFNSILDGSIERYTYSKYIKPHGSVNWFLEKRGGEQAIGPEMHFSRMVRFDIASSQMFNGSPLALDKVHVFNPNHKDMVNPDFISHPRFNHEYFYPLILIPLTTKLYPFFTYFNEKIISEGQKLLSQADNIYLIGYKAHDDIIFNDFLSKSPDGAKIHVISLNNADEIMTRILGKLKKLTKGITHNGGFKTFIDAF